MINQNPFCVLGISSMASEREIQKQVTKTTRFAEVGKDISFDAEIMKKYKQSEIFAFDPTPISMKWIENQKLPDNFYFSPIGISDKNGIEKRNNKTILLVYD